MALNIHDYIVSGHQQQLILCIKGKYTDTDIVAQLLQLSANDILMRVHMDEGAQVDNHCVTLTKARSNTPGWDTVHHVGSDIAKCSVWDHWWCR
jgi:hypothetical protein